MSSHLVKVLVPAVVVMPRGAQWAAAAAVWVAHALGWRPARAVTPSLPRSVA